MKNKLTDLHNHLFEELEWLGDRELNGEELTAEIRRADAMCKVAGQIIANGNLALSAAKFVDNAIDKPKLPPMLTE